MFSNTFSKTLLFLLVYLFSLTSVFAQVSNVTDFGGVPLRSKSQATRFSGNPYTTTEFVKGFIITTSKKQISQMLRYDAFEDKLQYMKDMAIYEASSPTIGGFILEVKNPKNNITERLNYKNGVKGIEGTSENSYFEVLYEGKHTILHKIFMQLKPSTATYGGMQSELGLESESKYFLVLPNGEVKSIKYNTSSILKALGNTPAQKTFVKENKINAKNKAELQKLMKYVDEQSAGK